MGICLRLILLAFVFFIEFFGYGQEPALYDTVWLSNTKIISQNEGEPCYILKERFIQSPVYDQSNGDLKNNKKIHGNISYDFQTRSHIDTPFEQHNFQQHIIRTSFNTSVLSGTPVNVNVAYRASNSPYLRNMLDVTMNYDPLAYKKNIAATMVDQAKRKYYAYYKFSELDNSYAQKLKEAQNWHNYAQTPDFTATQRQLGENIVSEMAEGLTKYDTTLSVKKIANPLYKFLNDGNSEKAASVIQQTSVLLKPKIDSFLNKHLDKVKKWQALKNKESKLSTEAKELYSKLQGVRKLVTDSLSHLQAKLAAARNGKELNKVLEKHGVSKDSLTRRQRRLMSLQSFSIGRSAPDYSELTVKNISITGISAAVSQGPYVALAAGYVDYRFREFIFKDQKMPKQAAFVGRIGLSGLKDRGIFLTFFNGKREINSVSSNSANKYYALSGFSVQGIFPLDKDNTFSAELAKSSAASFRAASTSSAKNSGGMLNFGLRSNEAYALQYNGVIHPTLTRVKAIYRKLGSDFQSFSLYTYNSSQTSYSVMMDQPFFKQVLVLRAGIKKNEFSYPYLSNLSSNSVFKTAQLTFRKKKLPTIVAGYYPATQLVMLPEKNAAEITYNTISISASHQYKLFNLSNSSMLIYSRFYNQSSDTAFLYFNAVYTGYQHFIWLAPFTVQAGYTSTKQQAVNIRTLESSLTWSHYKGFSVTGGVKYNSLPPGNMWGGNLRVLVPLKTLGSLQLSYDVSSLPAWQEKKLIPVSIGRLTYTNIF